MVSRTHPHLATKGCAGESVMVMIWEEGINAAVDKELWVVCYPW